MHINQVVAKPATAGS